MIDIKEIDIKASAPVYKQLIDFIENSIINGKYKPGEMLPSMSQMAKILDVSKETVKKSYGILTRRGLLESHQGIGYFVRTRSKTSGLKIVIMTDNLSSHRKVFLDAFTKAVGVTSVIHIMVHNNDVKLLEHFIDQSLGKYDYYVVCPHFPRDPQTIDAVTAQLSRIPSRHLILADRMIDSLKGDFGSVYQDFSKDVGEALKDAMEDLRKYPCLDVFTLSGSLYGDLVELSIAKFCDENGLHASFHSDISSCTIKKRQVCFIYDHEDKALTSLNEKANKDGFVIGDDIKIILFNETPLSGILFGGVSTISTDFNKMGRLCAEMILTGEMRKIKCDCRITRRRTF